MATRTQQTARHWTNVDELIVQLQNRWSTGQYARAYARGDMWEAVTLPVKSPKADELVDRLDEAVKWLAKFHRQSRNASGGERFSVQYRVIQNRSLGSNSVPCSIQVETFAQLCALLDTTKSIAALDDVIRMTSSHVPELIPWVESHPLQAIAHQRNWGDLLASVSWIASNETSSLYVRQIDAPRIDTKFVEANKYLLHDLLVAILPPDRVDSALPRSDFAGRFQFRSKPKYVRLRLLSPDPSFPAAITELSVRANELADVRIEAGDVFIVENEVSYLAFPAVENSIVMFGSGFALETLKALPWLDTKRMIYWGDIDTHGFTILSRLRARFPDVRSVLMDLGTLMAHRGQWAVEPSQALVTPPHLTPNEADLCRDLIDGRHGDHVRLEQERVRFSFLKKSLQQLGAYPPQDEPVDAE